MSNSAMIEPRSRLTARAAARSISGLLRRSGGGAASAPATSAGTRRRLPAIEGRPTLQHTEVRAIRTTLRIARVGRAQELSGFQCCIVDLLDQLLIVGRIGRETGKVAQIGV